jgi:hypothetical protein
MRSDVVFVNLDPNFLENAFGLGEAQCAEHTHGGKDNTNYRFMRKGLGRHLAHTTHVFTILRRQ